MGTDAYGLGRLERLNNPRTVWQHEAGDFTPWLAENIDLLSEAIGLSLTVVGQEVLVGDFRLDIHATDPDGKNVIIENQLEPSDHAHLGQLLVYASGLEASTAIWLTTRLREDHRSALNWLNERTDADVRAFGIEVSVVHIGDSLRAPVLDVVVEPNDWAKSVKETSKAVASPKNHQRMAFFEDVFELMRTTYPVIRTPKTHVTNWCSFASGPFGYYSLSFSKQGYRVEIYLDTGSKESTKQVFDQLAVESELVRQAVGFDLDWERLNSNHGSRIATYLNDFDLETADENTRQQAVEWSVDRAVVLHQRLDDRMRSLATAAKKAEKFVGQSGDAQ
ncbi:DUF4268 domain-containing protein [Amycolatopsis magusensis]|uniref:DUF4268 domain-containing protein n=1 Tax=Amycolatopsis magusensis TaxID=882444 RepID=UPI0024A90094|nr:DUF4268 domain-containing protein [Amycolatopsis magusensis]MDI5977354.1 DUF4268 domain-containing protein [Amycolatopsis magusensis]